MSSFEERQRGFEKKFELDAENSFKATSRAARQVGLWAAGQMGLSGDQATLYAQDVVAADLEQPSHDDLYAKLEADFLKYQVKVSRQQIVKTHEMYLAEARRDMAS